MNKTNDGSRYGLTQYRWPLDYELAGRSFTLSSARGSFSLAFRDREFVDCDGVLSQYQALKLDADTHFAVFGETLAVAVLDLKNDVAALRPDGRDVWRFCRIEDPDRGSTASLPVLTDEMTGTHVRWNFGAGRYVEQRCQSSSECRCVWSPRTDRPRTLPAAYIRLGENKYLTEVDGTSPFRTDMPQSFSKLILAQDYDRLLTVGCVYSPVLNEFRMISGYAMEP